jgi:methyltransferase (TIGR00027 family)
MSELQASRTAVLVDQGRAVAHGRIAPGRFADPTAMPLLRPEEQTVVRQVRDEPPPAGWQQRMEYEMIRACGELMVPRTVAIDDAIREHSAPQVVILGAGLDGRAWRMPELAEAEVYEVDQPASQQDKISRAAVLDGPPPHFVAVDFARDRIGERLTDAGHRTDRPTTWVWEGVVPYLTRAEVTTTAAAIAGCSAPGSRLIVNYQVPQLRLRIGRVVARLLTGANGRTDYLKNEPWRSTWTPAAMGRQLTTQGFTVTRDDDLLTLATALPMPITRPASLPNGRVVIADRL